jgi:hypothetical protein
MTQGTPVAAPEQVVGVNGNKLEILIAGQTGEAVISPAIQGPKLQGGLEEETESATGARSLTECGSTFPRPTVHVNSDNYRTNKQSDGQSE